LVETFRPLYKDGKPVVSYAAYAFRPEDNDLADAFNRELQAFMKTEEYRSIMKRYKVSEALFPPPGATAEAACRE
jgi:polar amino acid transport system substrate-binding protein